MVAAAARGSVDAVLDRVLDDVEPDELDRRGVAWSRCRFGDAWCELYVRRRSRLLMRLVTTTVVVRGWSAGADPDAARAGEPVGDIATIRLRHRGQLRRGSLTAAVSRRGRGDAAVQPMVDRLLDDLELASAAARLDVTRLVVALDARRRWRAEADLMGASFVGLRIPPSSRYTPLHGDQRDATVAFVHAVDAVIGSDMIRS